MKLVLITRGQGRGLPREIWEVGEAQGWGGGESRQGKGSRKRVTGRRRWGAEGRALHEVGDRDGTGGRRRVTPDPGREHRRGGGAQHVASAGQLGPLSGPGCGAQAGAGGSEHPQRPRRRAWGPRACSRPAPTSSPAAGSAQPRRPPAPQPPETRLPAPGARAAGATAGAGATPPPEGADARTSPARAAVPLPGPRRGTRAGDALEPRRCRRRAALRGAGRTTTPTMPRAPGGAGRGGALAGWDPDPGVDPRWWCAW